MSRLVFSAMILFFPVVLFGGNNEYDTLSIRPIGVDYSKYSGTNKLYLVGECDGEEGNQIVVFQNRPSFDFFENDQTYRDEQKALEKALWNEILDKDSEPVIMKGRWHQYNNRKVFLCNQILQIDVETPGVPAPSQVLR